MKKLCIALAIVCIILLLFGYLWKNGWIYHMVPLSEAKIREISEAWYDPPRRDYPLRWLDESYFGTYNGYVIFPVEANNFGGTRLTVAGILFKSGITCNIYAYKDGHFMDIRAAYNQGFLRERDVEKIAEQFYEYVRHHTS